jgi:hypothetical protein
VAKESAPDASKPGRLLKCQAVLHLEISEPKDERRAILADEMDREVVFMIDEEEG